jgi:hypothetical protein
VIWQALASTLFSCTMRKEFQRELSFESSGGGMADTHD